MVESGRRPVARRGGEIPGSNPRSVNFHRDIRQCSACEPGLHPPTEIFQQCRVCEPGLHPPTEISDNAAPANPACIEWQKTPSGVSLTTSVINTLVVRVFVIWIESPFVDFRCAQYIIAKLHELRIDRRGSWMGYQVACTRKRQMAWLVVELVL